MCDGDFIQFERMTLKGGRQLLCPKGQGDPEDISADAEVTADAGLDSIWNVAHMSVKDICRVASLTQE